MPRIQAASVAEHHARQRRALLDAARALLAETEQAPSMAAIGRRAGLARSSVYQYFASAEDLLAAVVADVFPTWAGQVLERVTAAPTPGTRIWAYVVANVDLFASSEQAVARALTRVVEPRVLQGPLEEFHAQLQGPLRQALAEFGEPEPETMAELIDSLIVRASQDVGATVRTQARRTADVTLARLRRLLGPYLGLGPQD
ncbi:TetR family transcriptional regulator [Micromonospora fiedleri]|uniref:TetR family transcriptional regulator n=1 Tax=Micromonospora fiedleri TaxID=1157498 RepID=A0ABS1UN18_9ACTN|nr:MULTISPECIES: TetR/AcrR family transcriptional regulator [Micromonospora]MBL6277239.1 TetR family transcriptional regulator [Micromonospora fiedleri]WSK43095.1 TetR/AcrR family transcriptional regulator [Micromonospora maris]